MKLKKFLPPFLITLVYWGLGSFILLNSIWFEIPLRLPRIFNYLFLPVTLPGFMAGMSNVNPEGWEVDVIIAQLIAFVILFGVISLLYFGVQGLFIHTSPKGSEGSGA